MGQSPFGELFSVSSEQTLQFFFSGLREVVSESVRVEDFLYPASILAHYAQVSCYCEDGFPCPRNLVDVFDNFVAPGGNPTLMKGIFDLGVLEIAGGQCLLLSGFFGREMSARHNIKWYVQNGQMFFSLVAENTVEREREARMRKMAEQFGIWHRAYSDLRSYYRESQYLIKIPKENLR